MNWAEACNNKLLQDLPYKVELNEWGQVLMSPASNRHGRNQMAIGARLVALIRDGEVIAECSIDTSRGVKVADVAWVSDAFLQSNGFETPYRSAPELCVEVISPSNSAEEIAKKTALYFECGALEVWLCDEEGALTFHAAGGPLRQSRLIPDFPGKV